MSNRFTQAPVLVLALTALAASVGFIFGIGGGAYPVIIAFAAVIVGGFIFDKKLALAGLVTLAVTAVSVAVAGTVMDMSYDGMYFHKQALYNIANGWNPLYQPLSEVDRFAGLQDLALWLDNYPKGVWSLYGAVYAICGRIEAAKGINILFVMMLFFSAFDTIKSVFRLRGGMRVVIAAVFAANPVILSQLFTFMNDLPVASLVMVCAFLGMKIFAEKADSCDYITLVAAFAASFTTKFTCPVYCGAVLGAYGVAYAIKVRDLRIIKPCAAVILSAALGVCLLGVDPYIKHMANGQHPVYPVMGEGKYDIMNTNAPEGFNDMPRVKQLAVSLFSQCAPNPGDKAVLKLPFTVTKAELDAVGAPDVRVSGFGVFFSGILLLSLLLAVYAAIKSGKNIAAVPAAVMFILLALLVPETWWARYNPYIYYIPCLLLLWFAAAGKMRVISYAMSVLMLVNGVISGVAVYRVFDAKTDMINAKLADMKADGRTVKLNINDFPSHTVWFDEAGVSYEAASDTPEGITPEVLYQTTKYWFE